MLNHCCFNKNICIYECFINLAVINSEKMDIKYLIAVFERKLTLQRYPRYITNRSPRYRTSPLVW